MRVGGVDLKHPDKWRDTVDPYKLPFTNFTLREVLGYPHAGNDVFHVRGEFRGSEVEAYIKVARQTGADIENEISIIERVSDPLFPTILDYDKERSQFVVSLAKQGERLSTIVKDNVDLVSMEYLFEYGQTLARLHAHKGNFHEVKDRRFFHIPNASYFSDNKLDFVYAYLTANQPQTITKCFCHGDFHYANILWHEKHISAILDFELAGLGNKEFDIAWALILRPGQKFLKTKEEIARFMDGYLSLGTCCFERVKYYMVLIYAYFYKIGSDDSAYQAYILNVFQNICSKEDKL